MKKRVLSKNIIIIFTLLIITFCIPVVSYAGDKLYHFMQAHQDYLITGKIVSEEDENLYKIQVAELITSSSIRTDIPKNIEVKIEASSAENNLKKGDYIALSLSKRGGGYKIENGWYKISTDNTDNLEVTNTNTTNNSNELVAVELFLKSRGKIKDFYFSENGTYVHKDSGIISGEDICIYSRETGKILPTEYEKNDKHIVENEKINIKTIMYLIIIFIVAQAITLFVYIKLNPNCKLRDILKYKEKD